MQDATVSAEKNSVQDLTSKSFEPAIATSSIADGTPAGDAVIDRFHTLQSIADEQQVKKRATQTWLSKAKSVHGELGAILQPGGPRFFSDEEREKILEFASERKQTKPEPAKIAESGSVQIGEPEPERQVQPREIEVLRGNHRGSLATPSIPKTIDLGQFRSDLAMTETVDNPLALAANFIAAADMVITAMDADERQMAGKIAQTRQARRAVTRKADQLKFRRQVYGVRSEILAQQQALENEGLTDGLEVLEEMGNGSGDGCSSVQ